MGTELAAYDEPCGGWLSTLPPFPCMKDTDASPGNSGTRITNYRTRSTPALAGGTIDACAGG